MHGSGTFTQYESDADGTLKIRNTTSRSYWSRIEVELHRKGQVRRYDDLCASAFESANKR